MLNIAFEHEFSVNVNSLTHPYYCADKVHVFFVRNEIAKKINEEKLMREEWIKANDNEIVVPRLEYYSFENWFLINYYWYLTGTCQGMFKFVMQWINTNSYFDRHRIYHVCSVPRSPI